MSKPLSPAVLRFHEQAAERLHELSEMLLPGAKLTLLVRRPEAPDGSQDMLVTDDDVGQAIRALRIRQAAEQPTAPETAPAPACTCGAQYSARQHEKHCAFQVWSFGQALTPEVKAIVGRFGCPHGYFKHECGECSTQGAPQKHTCGHVGPSDNGPWYHCGICESKGCAACEAYARERAEGAPRCKCGHSKNAHDVECHVIGCDCPRYNE